MYQGPIIDAHHHLWDLSLGRHRWLLDAGAAIGALGDVSYMRKNYLPADFLHDAAGKNVVGTVHIEAHWDRARDPVEETEWLEGIDKPGGVASRYIAFAPLTDPAVEKVLERQAAFPRVVGLRETIRWHPDPARSWAEMGLADKPAFRRGVGLLKRYNLALELLMNPYQAEALARLAGDFPAVTFLINHCATPVDRDAEGIERWKRGLKLMAARDNVAIKVSAFANFSPNKTLPEIRDNLLPCIDAFGTQRAMFGTDYPVGRRHMPYAGMVETFEALIADFSPDEQRALFHDNARRYYRFGG
jgi:predicted TIM-barrel fold metal-dependent hydrolase